MQLIEMRLTKFGDVEPRGTADELSGLADSMKTVGLIHPVVVNGEYTIIAGRRRVAAARLLEWSHIKAVVCETFNDRRKALLAEMQENTCRVALKPTQIKELADRIRGDEKPKAEARMKAGKAKGNEPTGQKAAENGASRPSGNLPEGRTGEVNEAAAQAAGVSRKTLEKIDAVIHAAEQNPERYGDLRDLMDDSGKVDGAFKEFQKRYAEDAKAAAKGEPDDPKADAAAGYCSELNALIRQADELFRSAEAAGQSPLGYAVHWNSVQQQIKQARQSIAVGRPKHRCPYCKGTGDDDGKSCRPCKALGWVCKSTYHNAPANLKGGDAAGGDDE